MKEYEKEIIAASIRAFTSNFGKVRIESDDCGGGFYVHYPPDRDDWVVYCPNIHYLDGWLYGAVQGVRRIEPMRIKSDTESEING